jgi:hypothetical protein
MERHEELQPRRLHKPNQLMKQLEEVVEEIQRLMLRSAEEASTRRSWTERNLHEQ